MSTRARRVRRTSATERIEIEQALDALSAPELRAVVRAILDDDAVRRRFERGRRNFFSLYRPLADAWRLYDATPIGGPRLIAAGGSGEPTRVRNQQAWRMAAEGFES